MFTQTNARTAIGIPATLRWVGLIGGAWAILTILGAPIAYLPGHPDFSPFTTYLSDMGDTPGCPQIIFNAGTLMAVPIRYAVLVLLVLRLRQLGVSGAFAIATLIVGFLSTAGTALMTATPFSVSPLVHKTGIGLYFLGVVVLQTIIFFKEWSLESIPRGLPLLSLAMIVFYLIFVILMVLYERGTVSRNAPVIWEWLAISTSIAWMLAQSLVLGRE